MEECRSKTIDWRSRAEMVRTDKCEQRIRVFANSMKNNDVDRQNYATDNIQGTFRTTDNVTPVSLYSAVHSVRWYTVYGTLHTLRRIDENLLPR